MEEENSKGGKTVDGKVWQAQLGDSGLSRSWLLNVLGEGKDEVESGSGMADPMGLFTERGDPGRGTDVLTKNSLWTQCGIQWWR